MRLRSSPEFNRTRWNTKRSLELNRSPCIFQSSEELSEPFGSTCGLQRLTKLYKVLRCMDGLNQVWSTLTLFRASLFGVAKRARGVLRTPPPRQIFDFYRRSMVFISKFIYKLYMPYDSPKKGGLLIKKQKSYSTFCYRGGFSEPPCPK